MGGRARGFAVVVAILSGSIVVGLPAAANGQPARPVPEAGSSDWRQVSAGGEHTCGIRTSGRLYCWGDDNSGQLGDSVIHADRPTPVEVSGGATDWTQVTAGGSHTCARRSTGRLYCWGYDESGQLGDGGANADQPTPVQVAGGATNWTQVSAGGTHTCARRSTGRLYCWGNDVLEQLGNGGTNTSQSTPVPVAGGATNWTQVTAGLYHNCARRSTGRLYCWGHDNFSQLGDGGTDTSQSTPVQVAGGATNWTQVSAGGSHTCARRSTGRLYCWGGDNQGQLGDGGTNTDKSTPVQIAGGATSWTQVTAGGDHTCGRRSTGRLFCWGNDNASQLGDGGTDTSKSTPVQVAGGATDWRNVDGGAFHTCAPNISRRLFCWGRDTQSQLGDAGTNADQPVPAQVWA